MRVFVSHSEARPFEVERFSAAWRRGGGQDTELRFVTPLVLRSGNTLAFGRRCIPRGGVAGTGRTASLYAGVLAPCPAGASAPSVSHRISGTEYLVAADELAFTDVAGVILSGGPDVEPSRYGAAPSPGIELRLDPARDAFDLDLIATARRLHLPVFGICYGCQILAVEGGGTLIQDLPSAGLAGHHIATPKDHRAHEVAIAADARFLGPAGGTLAVNSRHHQAVATLGAGWRVVAQAADGVIEAIEPVASDRFVLGVQWHPENIAHVDHDALFVRFRAACRAHAGEV